MTPFRLALLGLLATPVLAQSPAEDIGARLEACLGGLDLEVVGARAEAFAAAHDYEARVAGLCAAGDEDGATEFARGVEDAFYASDPDAARMRACMLDALGQAAMPSEAACGD